MFPFGSRHLVIALALLVGTTGIVVATERSGGDDQAALAPAADTLDVGRRGDGRLDCADHRSGDDRLPAAHDHGDRPTAGGGIVGSGDRRHLARRRCERGAGGRTRSARPSCCTPACTRS